MISVYGGTGFIGGAFCDLYPDEVVKIPRESRKPESKDILYLISTTSNYNILEDLHLDINTNLNVLMETLQHCQNLNSYKLCRLLIQLQTLYWDILIFRLKH